MWFRPTDGADPLLERLPGRHRDLALSRIHELHRGVPPYLDQAPNEFPFATNRRELVAAAGFGPGAAAPSTLLKPLEAS